jgi:hypothetical protein
MNFIIPHLDLLGLLLVLSGFFDGYKYHIEACAIRKAKTAKGHSRRFINWATAIDVYRLYYLFHNNQDIFLILATVLAILFMLEMWYTIYLFYPYRKRYQTGFKRPSILVYLVNSLLSNKVRERL